MMSPVRNESSTYDNDDDVMVMVIVMVMVKVMVKVMVSMMVRVMVMVRIVHTNSIPTNGGGMKQL